MQISMNREGLEIRISKEDTRLTVALAGSLDTRSSPELEMEILPLFSGVTEFIMDFSALDYITSAGLRVLLKAAKIMEEQGEMIVLNPNDDAQEVFARTGFDGFLTIRHTQPEDACGDETAP